jgi:integrase
MFKWGREYYRVLPAYGGMFSAPAKSSVRKERKEFRPFTRAELRKLLDTAPPVVKCFVLLGLNCGFGATDCSRLPVSAVDFQKKMIHFPRGKTGVERRCPLWPETIKALQAYQRPNTMLPELFFVTRFGRPYVSELRGTNDAGELVRSSRADSVYQEFALAQMVAAGKVKNRYARIRDGLKGFKPRGFYVLRHMFRSIAEETGKVNAIRVIMGHAQKGMDEYYLHLKMTKYRDLKVVTERVRRWVFGK